MNTGHDGFSRSRVASRKWPISWTKISSDDAEREPPAPDQRVAAERDEHAANLASEPSFASSPSSDDEPAPDLPQEARASRCRAG